MSGKHKPILLAEAHYISFYYIHVNMRVKKHWETFIKKSGPELGQSGKLATWFVH